jgi:hypothetical protein
LLAQVPRYGKSIHNSLRKGLLPIFVTDGALISSVPAARVLGIIVTRREFPSVEAFCVTGDRLFDPNDWRGITAK